MRLCATMSFLEKLEKDASPPTPSRLRFGNEKSTITVHDFRPENVQKFVEDQTKPEDQAEYSRTGSDAGVVVIFNHEVFDDNDLRTRYGTRRDVNELIVSLGRLGYNIEKEHIHNDFTREEVIDELAQISAMDFTDKNSVIVVFLTHGNSNNILNVKDGIIETREVWEYVLANRTLDQKPKFFLFQACKGDSVSTAESDESVTNIVPIDTFKISSVPDVLIVYSVVEGNSSFRHPTTGSWFIQEFCRNVLMYGRRDDVVSIILRVCKCIANNYFNIYEGTIEKQMPFFVSTLTKKFYLTKSKDRSYLIGSVEHHKALEDSISELQKQIDILQKKYEEDFL